MKKLSIAIVLLLIFAAYSFHENNEAHVSIIPPKSSSSGNNQNNSSLNSPNDTSTPSAGNSNNQQQVSGIYKDGTYQGDTADAYYGPMQVQVTVSNGKISDVQVLQSPNDRGESVEINDQALPQLKQEAIQAQSAQIDVVSGATQSSQGFQQSLQSALNKAKA